MGDKADGRLFAGEFGVDVAVLFVLNGLYAHLTQFAVKEPGEVALFGSSRLFGGFLVGLGVDPDISDKSVDQVLVGYHLHFSGCCKSTKDRYGLIVTIL